MQNINLNNLPPNIQNIQQDVNNHAPQLNGRRAFVFAAAFERAIAQGLVPNNNRALQQPRPIPMEIVHNVNNNPQNDNMEIG